MSMGNFDINIRLIDDFCSRFFGASFHSPITICDPCCRDGSVIEVFKTYAPKAITYGVESDYNQALVANRKIDYFFNMEADAIKKSKEMFNFLYLNAPRIQKDALGNVVANPLLGYLKSWCSSVVVGGYMLLVLSPDIMQHSNTLHSLYIEGFGIEAFFSDEVFVQDSNNTSAKSLSKKVGLYQDQSVFFALFKRSGVSKKYNSFDDFLLPFNAELLPFDEVKIPKVGKLLKVNIQNKVFTSSKSLKVWQLIDFAERRTNHPFKRKIKDYESTKSVAVIDSPNDGQALLMLLSGQLDKPIANNFLLKGNVKKKSIKQQISKTKARICDYYSSQLFCYDILKNKYFKLS